jgi:hypothetical protein
MILPDRKIVRRPFFAWGNVPDTLNVAFTSPEWALKVEADADCTENRSEENTIAAMSPDRIDVAGLGTVDPSRLVELKLSELILVTSDVLSPARNKLQVSLNNQMLCSDPRHSRVKCSKLPLRARRPSFD